MTSQTRKCLQENSRPANLPILVAVLCHRMVETDIFIFPWSVIYYQILHTIKSYINRELIK